MLRHLLPAALLFFCTALLAQDDFEQWRVSSEEQWRGYERQVDDAFLSYKKHIKRMWAEFVDSTPTVWVEYGPDKTERSAVDFEQGTVQLAVLLDADTPDAELAKKKLRRQLVRIVGETDSNGAPVLKGQIDTPLGEPLDETNIDSAAPQMIRDPHTRHITTAEGPKIRYTVTLDLVDDHLQERIDRYLPDILSFCRRFEIPTPLVLGVIHTESSFNPRAVNRESGACGLMQIVPQYAGVTMNRILRNDSSEPTPKQLFDPRFNLEMGIGYLHYLEVHYFVNVTQAPSRYYSMIAAYNGGAGNVFRTFTGQSRRSDEFTAIVNGMEPEDVFVRLTGSHPYGETRRYLIMVTSRTEDYGGL